MSESMLDVIGKSLGGSPAFETSDNMNMKVVMLAAVVSVLISCVKSETKISVIGAEVTEAGIYSAQVVKEFSTPGVVGGTNQGLDAFTLVQATTNIPARVGTRFGFRYTIHGTHSNVPIVLTMVAENPPLKDPKSGKTQSRDEYELHSWIGRTYTSYSFDEEWELIPGKWRFEVWHKGQKLCEQCFLVVPDTMQKSSNEIGAVNGSQPSRTATNRTSSTPSSRR